MRIFVLLYEFLLTRKCNYLLSLLLSAFIGFLVFYCSEIKENTSIIDLRSSIVNVIGILLGFSISVLAIFISGGNHNIESSKAHSVGIKIWKGSTVSLYDKIVIDLSYIIILQGVVLACCFIIPNFMSDTLCYQLKFSSIIIGLTTHIILMIIGIVMDFYLIVSKKQNEN